MPQTKIWSLKSFGIKFNTKQKYGLQNLHSFIVMTDFIKIQ